MHDFSGKTVYLAKVSSEMEGYSKNLIKELERFGCEVKILTQEALHGDEASDFIEQCDLAIHLLSGLDHFEEKQLMISVGYLHSKKIISDTSESMFEIYAWHPRSHESDTVDQTQLPHLINSIQQMEEVELLNTTFEEFKNYIFQRLPDNTEEMVDEYYIKGSEQLNTYFIYDALDRELVGQYVDLLKQRGLMVATPDFGDDIMEIRHKHNAALKNFDLVVIYVQHANINWVNMKIMDVLKSPGLGREKDILGKAIIAPDQLASMLTANSKGFDIIRSDTTTAQDQIDQFLKGKDLV